MNHCTLGRWKQSGMVTNPAEMPPTMPTRYGSFSRNAIELTDACHGPERAAPLAPCS